MSSSQIVVQLCSDHAADSSARAGSSAAAGLLLVGHEWSSLGHWVLAAVLSANGTMHGDQSSNMPHHGYGYSLYQSEAASAVWQLTDCR